MPKKGTCRLAKNLSSIIFAVIFLFLLKPEILHLQRLSGLDVKKARTSIRPYMFVGLGDNAGLIINRCCGSTLRTKCIIIIIIMSDRMLGLIRTKTRSIFTLDTLLRLHSNSVTPKLEYALTVWNSITSTDVRKLECIQRKLVAPRQYRFFTHDNVTYGDFLQFLKLLTFDNRRLFLITFLFLFIQV